MTAVLPGLGSVLVELDPLAGEGELADAERQLAERVTRIAKRRIGQPRAASGRRGRTREIPVVYGGEHGPDLEEVARLTGLSTDDVVTRHTGAELRVAFLGFAPGFAYITGLQAELDVPRLATPRTVTPAGSVGLAAGMTGIYPASLPGGWRVIGRTPITLFDALSEPPAYLAPGDHVRFVAIPRARFGSLRGLPEDW
jgi:KipI family sensor histidine kinase inhibitor